MKEWLGLDRIHRNPYSVGFTFLWLPESTLCPVGKTATGSKASPATVLRDLQTKFDFCPKVLSLEIMEN